MECHSFDDLKKYVEQGCEPLVILVLSLRHKVSDKILYQSVTLNNHASDNKFSFIMRNSKHHMHHNITLYHKIRDK